MGNSKPSFDAFSFPLNVYARLVEIEGGRVDYMHYGLFATKDAPANAAQQRSSDLLWQHLPPPCKLLDVGVGLGTTLNRLLDSGYTVTGITPDSAQVDYVRLRHGSELPVRCCAYESFDAEPGTWNTILFQESAQYIDAIDIFDRADSLLADDGEIVVMDEFHLECDRPGLERLHSLENFLRLAERFGFSVVTQFDLTTQAAPTLDWLLASVARHGAILKAELGVSDEQLDALNQSNLDYQKKYAEGRYGYYFLRLKRVSRPPWRLGRIIGERSGEMRELFAKVFEHEMSEAHWQWKYGDERGMAVGVWSETDTGQHKNGELVAHYGGTSRQVMYFGQPAQAFQACDLMVSDKGRGSLSRRGPVFLAAATFLEHELGYGAPHLLGIGFPNERAYRVPAQLGLYAGCLARIHEVSWPVLITRPALRVTLRELSAQDVHLEQQIEECWAAMRSSLGGHIVGVRDAAYIKHRYLDHPDKSYRLFLVKRRFGGEPIGLLVLRQLDDKETSGERRVELLDAIGAISWMPLLVRYARRVAAAWGAATLFCWLADNIIPHFQLPAEAVTRDLEVLVPGNNWTSGPPIETLAGLWWLTGGDTDFH